MLETIRATIKYLNLAKLAKYTVIKSSEVKLIKVLIKLNW